jgi:hypothetical protein
MDQGRPYISVVVTTRNDDHGVNPLRRTQAFINGLIEQCNRHKVPMELVIVEWNPPANRLPLADQLHWPPNRDYCPVRIIRVPPSIHARYQYGDMLPLYQMIAKNAGIRRSRGDYILCTNIDILFSHELMQCFAGRKLERNRIYRLDRFDVNSEVPLEGIDGQLAYCEQNLIRINAREGTFLLDRQGLRRVAGDDIMPGDSGIRMGAGWYYPEMDPLRLCRWMEEEAEILFYEEGQGYQERTLVLEMEPSLESRGRVNRVKFLDGDGRLIGVADVAGKTIVRVPVRISKGRVNRILLRQQDQPRRIALHKDADQRMANVRTLACGWAPEKTLPGSWLAPWRKKDHGKLPEVEDVFADFTPGERPARLGESADGPLSIRYGVWWERGWYELERFEGKMFVWCSGKGRLILRPPVGANPTFRMKVAPGPACGYAKSEIVVRDEAGQVVANCTVEKEAWIEIACEAGRSRGFAIEASSEGKPISTPGDQRRLMFLVSKYGWGKTGAFAELIGRLSHAAPTPTMVKLGAGWETASGFRAQNGAELFVQLPGARDFLLTMEVMPAGGSAVIQDTDGNELARWDGSATEIPVRLHLPETGVAMMRILTANSMDVTGISVVECNTGPAMIPVRQLHCNACGDFTLMHESHWRALRGYTEADLYSMNIDSLFCWTARFAGIEELELREPMRIYHIEHGMGSGWTPEGESLLYQRLAQRGIDWMDYADVQRMAYYMYRSQAPMLFCGEDWGLANDVLEEIQI